MSESGPYFDDAGAPCSTVGPVLPGDEAAPDDVRAARLEVIARLLALLAAGSPSTEAVGRRVALLNHIVNGTPRRQSDLARQLGVSRAAVSQALNKLRLDLRARIDD